jgi:adenosylcobinamide-phosphate synthase
VAGVAIAVTLPAFVCVLVAAGIASLTAVNWLLGTLLAGSVLYLSSSLRQLLAVAESVVRATAEDLEAARAQLPALVGREPGDLSAGQIRSAAVESAAENLADGLVAPLLAFSAGSMAGWDPAVSLALGAGLAAAVKSVNTLDSMLGYPKRAIGWGPARLDDAVMWLPARVTALALALCRGQPTALSTAKRDRDAVPSPNSGWPMGTLAVIAGVTLEKPGVYVLNGRGDLPDIAAAESAIRTVAIAGVGSYAMAGIFAAVPGVTGWL